MLQPLAARRGYEDALSRLVLALRRAKAEGTGATVLLGAGCSLTSTRDEVSTSSILRSIVATIEPHTEPVDDAALFRIFVKHWRNLSDPVRRSLLEERLEGLEPSTGYFALRRLAELGYVSTVVTTNFDLLVDQVLEGLPHVVRVGTADWRPRPPSPGNVQLIKVHGDIREGQLRFDPKDLDELPSSIVDDIRLATDRPTLVCGFRGQDRGLMSALCESDRHGAFWSSPEFPDSQQDYIYDRLDDWMRRRSSAANYICGALGRFDSLMETLVDELGRMSAPVASRRMPAAWNSTSIGRLINRNSRVEELFAAFLSSCETYFAARSWVPQPPAFPVSYRATIETLGSLTLPGGLLSLFEASLGNEIDALFLGAALELSARTGGWPLAHIDLIDGVRGTLERSHPTLGFDDAFWEELKAVLEGPLSKARHIDFALRLNNSNRLSMIASRVPTGMLGAACSVVSSVVNMCVPADRNAADISNLGDAKLAAAGAAQSLVVQNGKAHIHVGGVTEEAFGRILTAYGSRLPGGLVDGAGLFRSDYLDVEAEILRDVKTRPRRSPTSLVAAVAEKAAAARAAWPSLDVSSIPLRHDAEIAAFLKAAPPAAFLVGPSGAGKTTTVGRLIAESAADRYVLPLSGRACSLDRSAAQLFFGVDLISGRDDLERFIVGLDGALRLRSQRLLLALDGLNEATAQTGRALFDSLLDLAECLFSRGATQIKLLVTSQERSLLSFLQDGRRPSVGIFYWPSVDTGTPRREPFIRTQPLTVDEQSRIVASSFPAESGLAFERQLLGSPSLRKLFDQPILLEIAAQLRNEDLTTLSASPAAVFDAYRTFLLRRASADLPEGALETVIRTYFEIFLDGELGGRVQRFGLLQRAQAKIGPIAQRVVKAMEDVGILRTDPSDVVGYVTFRHERLEVSMLADFLAHCSTVEGELQAVLDEPEATVIVMDAVQALVSRQTSERESDDRFLTLVADNLDRWPWVAVPLAAAMVESRSPAQAVGVLFESAARVGRHAGVLMSRTLARGLATLVDRGLSSPLAVCEAVVEATQEMPADRAAHAELHTAAATCAYDVHEQLRAEKHIEAAARVLGIRADAKLARKIAVQRARIIGRWASRAQALEILSELFADIMSNGPGEAIVECAIEYGDMLRDSAMFDEAIDVYKQAERGVAVAPEAQRQRLRLQRAVALKNKMQLVLRPSRRAGVLPADDVVLDASTMFQRAIDDLDGVASWAKEAGAVGVMLAALSERSEATIVLSWARPDLNAAARACLEDLENGLRIQNLVTHRIEWGRQVARLAEIEGRYEDAMVALRRARATAVEAQQAYNVCDCDYQIGRLALFALKRNDRTYLSEGREALRRAAKYLRTETAAGNSYLTDVIGILTELDQQPSN